MDPRIAIVAGLVLIAFGAGWLSNGWRLNGKHDHELVRMHEAGQKALAKHDAQTKVVIGEYREELAALSARKPKRVLFCPTSRLPHSPGGTPGAGADLVDQHDYGPDLREAVSALIRCNKLIEVLK